MASPKTISSSRRSHDKIDWSAYCAMIGRGEYDEMFNPRGKPRWASNPLVEEFLDPAGMRGIARLQNQVEAAIDSLGISFAVYGEKSGLDRAWPLDLIPRVIDADLWRAVANGLQQRLRALNLFLDDVYHRGRILRDGVVPEALVKSSPHYRPQCADANPAFGVWAHICGSDLVRDADGAFYVLEDNLRTPSGVSYMIENREVMTRVAAEMFASARIESVSRYPQQLLRMLGALSPRAGDDATVVLLTPGAGNSAYFEHDYLARQMGVALAEGGDLTVVDNVAYLRTIAGLARVDIVYRRVDDDFLDPRAFRRDSLVGVGGLFSSWRAGNVAIVNAPGCGVADDKVVYSYVPDIIRYYLSEEPLLPNVPTWRLDDKKTRDKVFARAAEYVFKPANESGGKGIVVGPRSTKRALEQAKRRIAADPRGYVAQPLISLSTSPTVCGRGVAPRRVDLRPFTVQTDRCFTTGGGLTRVARRAGSFIVNSSQGGGSKDTWIVQRAAADS